MLFLTAGYLPGKVIKGTRLLHYKNNLSKLFREIIKGSQLGLDVLCSMSSRKNDKLTGNSILIYVFILLVAHLKQKKKKKIRGGGGWFEEAHLGLGAYKITVGTSPLRPPIL